jgi:sec-independent protein translocase protein TatB
LFSRVRVFDIGFSELMVIGLVALIVIGPERLPRVARTIGHLAGRPQPD